MTVILWWGKDAEQQHIPCSGTRCPGGGHAGEALSKVLCWVLCCAGLGSSSSLGASRWKQAIISLAAVQETPGHTFLR